MGNGVVVAAGALQVSQGALQALVDVVRGFAAGAGLGDQATGALRVDVAAGRHRLR